MKMVWNDRSWRIAYLRLEIGLCADCIAFLAFAVYPIPIFFVLVGVCMMLEAALEIGKYVIKRKLLLKVVLQDVLLCVFTLFFSAILINFAVSCPFNPGAILFISIAVAAVSATVMTLCGTSKTFDLAFPLNKEDKKLYRLVCVILFTAISVVLLADLFNFGTAALAMSYPWLEGHSVRWSAYGLLAGTAAFLFAAQYLIVLYAEQDKIVAAYRNTPELWPILRTGKSEYRRFFLEDTEIVVVAVPKDHNCVAVDDLMHIGALRIRNPKEEAACSERPFWYCNMLTRHFKQLKEPD